MPDLVMGYWDCPYCGNKGNRGDVVNCPSCGRARGEVKFYVKGYEEGDTLQENELGQLEQLSEEKAQTFSKNPDWYCSFCNSLNSDNAETCGNCGASRADSEANYFEMLKKKQEREAAEAAAQSQNSAQQKRSRKPLLIAVCILLALIGLFAWFNGNKTAGDLKVTALNWVRNINIEEYKMFSASGWSVPQDLEYTITDQRREISGYTQVYDHDEEVQVPRTRQVYDHDEYTLEDNGNGTFTKVSHPVYRTETYYVTERRPVYVPVPQYATKYYFDYWQWTPSRDVTASGEDHNAEWPEVALEEKEREGQRSEVYRFTVEHQKKQEAPVTYRVDESVWQSINIGDQVYITEKRTGANPYLSDAKGNKVADLIKER